MTDVTMNSRRTLLLALLIALAFGIGLFAWQSVSEDSQEARVAMLLPQPVELPEFALLNESGESIGRNYFAGQWDLVFFGFTNCPDICPTTLQTLSVARRQLAETGFEPLPRIVLVSVDTARDTVDAMRAYVGYFGDGVTGVTGSDEEIRRLTKTLGIFYQKVGDDSENYNVDHSAVVLVIDNEARFSALFSAPHKPQNFVSDLPGLIRQ